MARRDQDFSTGNRTRKRQTGGSTITKRHVLISLPIVLATTLNVRSGPGTEYTIVAQLYSGEDVIVTGEVGDGWLNIKTGEFTGCVKGSYLEKK